MAAVVTLLTSGSYSSTTTTTTLVSNSFNTGASSSGARRMLLVFLAADNYGTSGVSSIIAPTNTAGLSFTPVIANNSALVTSPTTLSAGTGYVTITNPSASPAVGSGVSVSAWFCTLPTTWSDTAMTITFNFSPATRTKVYAIYSVAAEDFGANPIQYPLNIPAGVTSTSLSMTGGASYGSLWWGISGVETNAAPSAYWSGGALQSAGLFTANSGTITTSQRLYVDYVASSTSGTTTASWTVTQTSADSQHFGFILEIWEAPSAPVGVNVTSVSSQSATLSWSPPTNYGGRQLYDYTIQYRVVGGTTWTTYSHAVSTATTQTITGLTNGTTYEFQVAAVTQYGTTKTGPFAASSNTATPQITVLVWGQNAANIDPTKIVPWSYFWSAEQTSIQQYANAGTLVDGTAMTTSTPWLPSIGTATVTNFTSNYRKNKSEVNYYDSISRVRAAYSATSMVASTYLEIWWVANLIDIALPTSGATYSHWFGWPTTGFGSNSLYDYRDTTGARWCFTDGTSSTAITAGATVFTTPGTYLYRARLVDGSLSAQLYRNNQLFTNSSTTGAAFYTAASWSNTFNFGYAVSGTVAMRASGFQTPTPTGPGPYIPFVGIYTGASLTTQAQQDLMLQWAQAKYNLSA